MTKVFVHGNPESADIWSPLVELLQERRITDVVLLSPPGFGSPVPAGFTCTRREYVQWLASELKAIGGDIDLVGHDWGAGHVFGVLAEYPGIVRTWAADCMGLLHHDYVWHDAAQGWQTPELGEQMMKGLVDLDLDSFIAAFGALGISESVARAMKPHINDVMADSVVRLYRDAAQPVMRHLGEKFVSQKPKRGLVIIAENDQYAGPHETHEQLASAVGAKVARLDGCGHWWMIEKPQEAARILASHWIR